MQTRPPGAVRHVHVGQHRHKVLGAANGVIGGGDMQRRLPVLVPCVDIRLVTQKNLHRVLKQSTGPLMPWAKSMKMSSPVENNTLWQNYIWQKEHLKTLTLYSSEVKQRRLEQKLQTSRRL